MTLRTEKITFLGSLGNPLSARFDSPTGDIKAYALFVHCFACSKDLLAARRVSAALTAKGIAVLRFDLTGLGESEGEFSNTNFSTNIGDIEAAIDFMTTQNKTPHILIGHSLGGTAVLHAAASLPELKVLVTINAPNIPTHVYHLFKDSLHEIESQGEARVDLQGRPFNIQKQFLDDLEKYNAPPNLRDIHAALLIFHSPQDNTVALEEAKSIFANARHPKNFISLYNADHLLTNPLDALYVADITASWVNRYLLEETQETAYEAPSNEVIMTEVEPGKFTQLIQMGEHTIMADEPLNLGGNDKGPGPYELILASLGACTSMTIRMYATRKNIPLEGISVTLTHEKVYNEDLSNCVEQNERLDLVHRHIHLRGNLTTEQQEDLLRIANKCPVHKTLTQSSVVKTSLI